MDSPREPQQERSRTTLLRILEATNHIIADSGVAPLTLAAVAAEAGVAVGSIYTKFKNKQELIAAAYDRWMDQAIQEVTAERTLGLAGATGFEALVEAHVLAVTRVFERHANLIRGFALSDAMRGAGIPIQVQANQAFHVLAQPLIEHRLRPSSANATSIAMALFALQATLEWRVLHGAEVSTESPLAWPTLAVELARMTRAYLIDASALTQQSPAQPSPDQRP
jgi:AcrR family transcriptional regulator